MDGYLILDFHFVEFINAANAVVSEHECSGFNAKLTSLWVFSNAGSQTSCTTCLSTRVDSSGEELADVFEELALCCCRVANDADVDVATQLEIVSRLLRDSAEQLQKQAFFDVEVTVDSRRD